MTVYSITRQQNISNGFVDHAGGNLSLVPKRKHMTNLLDIFICINMP